MSYCRFRNTLGDLQDCLQSITEEGFENLSFEELRAARNLYEVCREFVDECQGYIEGEIKKI